MILGLRTINFSLDYGFFWPLIVFLLSIFISYLCYPVIIRVSKMKKLMAKPNHRSSHKIQTPNLGGIGVFLSINLIITLLGNYFEDDNLITLLGATTILFFMGLVDDLIDMKAAYKLLAQMITALAIVFITNIQINDLHGLLGIHELPYLVSVALTVLVYVLIINSYNLIDGVDGLAGIYAVTISTFFGVFYFFNGNDSMFFLSICVVGSLISFLIFNLSKKEKIFMGDTGSLVIGFLLAYQAIEFLSVDFNPNFMIQNTKAPIFVLALFSFPFIDTTRVFTLRLLKRKSPFTADKSHVHHVLLNYGLKHWKIAVLASLFSVFMVLSIFVFNELTINKQLLLLVSLWVGSVLIVQNILLVSKLRNGTESKLSDEDPIIKNKPKGKTIILRDWA